MSWILLLWLTGYSWAGRESLAYLLSGKHGAEKDKQHL